MFRAEKAGHAGTLDPLASGLLPVLLGDATRFSAYLLDAPKGYAADIRLGVTTATADAEGEVLETRPVEVDRAQVDAVLARFLGPQQQVPPMHSAIKREGVPLYVLARRGESVERKPRDIVISSLDLLAYEGDLLRVQVACSKGTYIRTLAEDIGAALGCGAHLGGLRRTATGPFDLGQAVTLEALEGMEEAERDRMLAPTDRIVAQLPEVDLDRATRTRFCHGQTVAVEGLRAALYRVYGEGRQFVGLGESPGDGRLVPKRLLAGRSEPLPSG